MSDINENIKEKGDITAKQSENTVEIVDKDWFMDWFIDVEKLFALFATLICGYIVLSIKSSEQFLTFESRQPNVNDVLHDFIFEKYLENLTMNMNRLVVYLLIVAVVLFVVSYIMDYEKTGKGYILRITGMLVASLTGIGYILVPIGFGFARPVMNINVYIFISMVLIGLAFAATSWISYKKTKRKMLKAGIALKVTMAICILGCFIGSTVYLVKNLGADYGICHEVNQLLDEHPTELNRDIEYQMGNVVKLDAIYHDGAMYYVTQQNIWRIDASGTKESVFSVPQGRLSVKSGIFYHDGNLYVGCFDYNDEGEASILQISVSDGTEKEMCSLNTNRIYFGVADGKLLYTEDIEEDKAAVFCIDLTQGEEPAEAILYDKGIDKVFYLEHGIWMQKYLYGYLENAHYWPEKFQFIGTDRYYLCDYTDYEEGEHKWGGEYPYSAKGNCTLERENAAEERERVLEQVVEFNIFNDTIYYVQETTEGYDFYFCDKNGENIRYIASVPVAFEEAYAGCSAHLLVGEGFMVCEVYAPYFETEYVYFIDMENGTVKEL